MKIEFPGSLIDFGDITPGTLFMCWNKQGRVFGFSVIDGKRKAAIMFYEREGRPGLPWLMLGGLPRYVVAFPTAVVRPNAEVAASLQGIAAAGAVIQTPDAPVIMSMVDQGEALAFNLATGQIEDGPFDARDVVYPEWEAGIIIDGKFQSVFSFPPKK
jgi:hypothetical protein